jgi:hypothetical protein
MRARATGTRCGRSRPLVVTAGIGALLLASVGGAAASPRDGARDPGSRWFSIGLMSGSTRLDSGLSDYRWDMTPRMDWGAQALAGRGRFATGLRVWRAQTSQLIDPADAASAAQVRVTTTELVGHGRFATALGCDFMAVASTGLLHLGYHPDRVTVAPPLGGTPVAVDLAPVNEWVGGAGLAMRRPIGGAWAAGMEVEHGFFALDTAHRNGSTIEYGRRTFGDWSARFELAWASR